jgi:hypothetical protein
MLRSSWVAVQLVASQEGLSSVRKYLFLKIRLQIILFIFQVYKNNLVFSLFGHLKIKRAKLGMHTYEGAPKFFVRKSLTNKEYENWMHYMDTTLHFH